MHQLTLPLIAAYADATSAHCLFRITSSMALRCRSTERRPTLGTMASSAPSTAAPVRTDPLRCPLCGQSNQCAITAGLAPESCWCMTTDIAPAALAAIPEAQRRQSCLCPRCAAGQFPGSAGG